ncbi:adenosylmethionine--8-amino-7-oxononanoate transaminase [Psychromonas sp. psych-6C06]|uniref:adenosylmethionine--8-amino-7-oxononanoate transaminase n=1 Tax=Psychromonas sp. psych-6C06 TaxID=2058089 RepID=UPI000C3336E4|nr:adenosylmethionine--8-amino-7-oxononanoate transaminase [Psychromonas sp. psych-6C06]PKF63850.1 adenosylmethionine--8-amino-7-oxononanoate transaminase [Psychromonas sp. psych-6C06]
MSLDHQFDKKHLWHPYTSMSEPLPCYGVESAEQCLLTLESGEKLIDGMSSWWACLFGYNVPELNAAAKNQIDKMAHVMFGGLTHQPAIELGKKLVSMTPKHLEKVFLCDSGSVAVEVSLKMALQYWHAKGTPKSQFLTIRNGYHGDTFGAMSVTDPEGAMHDLYHRFLPEQIFAPQPSICFHEQWNSDSLLEITELVINNKSNIAAIILEPIVQGAGGMYFYHPEYLKGVRALCDEYDLLLIADEIATGFGRTGKLFACEHADINPDIICVGKSLTGGYMSLAATLTTEHIARTISDGKAGVFMHGPTFMGNPLACAVANASLDKLMNMNWQQSVKQIEQWLQQYLSPCHTLSTVKSVRVLGAIGVVQLNEAVDVAVVQKKFVELGVWIRPFGKLVYVMPPYIITEAQLKQLCDAIYQVVTPS